MVRHLTAVLAAITLALGAAGCGDTGGDDPADRTLTVFAAASLTETFTELGKTFEKAHPGVRVRFSFGGSSTLAQQIVQGAPVDVFAAASPATMRPVSDERLTADAPRTFARNRLVIAVPPGDPAKIRTLRDLAGRELKVVLCAPQVPCGAAAEKALDVAGVKVTPVSQEQDVKAVLTKVRLGEADAGLVYRTDVRAAGGQVEGVEFPESAEAINDYPIAALAKAPQPGLAGEFVDLVLSAQGRAVLTRAGFESA
ncbi:molybdate transport system substrate-binding protein [Thermomonospora echinospora]|uniref:Molybdate transport system substrate-binding protein n=1 Tax=Thermomonospora echinospora TaxID=1992 RepID=A0A1H5SX18_9ACTN|nr:molybdate ABC transporter substrate-binding protein [Thermomonospora echinospora]SEF55106.1 molybdate transport system substrate-binding protein [Thermomonospora echinospora]